MSDCPARITQAEINRVVRAAKKGKFDSDGPWVKIVFSSDKLVAESQEVVL